MKRSFSSLQPLIITLLACLGLIAGGAVVAQQKKKPQGPPSLKYEVQQLHKDNNEGLAVGDINNDGKLDIVAGEYWYEAPEFTQHKVRRLEPFGKDYLQSNSDHLHDVNGDGLLDVVAGGFTTTEVFWYENPGPGNYAAPDGWKAHSLADTGATRNEISYLRDMDGDGTPEWVTNSWDDSAPLTVWRFDKDDSGKPILKGHTVSESGNGHGMGFGDINGDGLEDIIFKQGWYERPKDGPYSGPWAYHDDFNIPHASCPVLVVDLDEDGKNDIIWADGHNYGLYWMRQQAPQPDGATSWRQHEIDKKFSQAHALAWEDIDNDGAPELITGKRYYAHSGNDPGAEDPVVVLYFDWNKDAQTWTKHTISQAPAGEGPGIGLQIRVADLDADGWKDIALPGKSGTHILWNKGMPKG